MKILLIEDEEHLADSIINFLKKEGFLCEWAKNFKSADEKIDIYEYECALVDITLPDGNGLDTIRALKETKPKTGIIIISAKNSLDDKINGLELGADDYITKPFHLAELNARIKSVIRRKSFEGNKIIHANDIRIYTESQEVFVNEKLISLTKKEYTLLLFFIANKNRVLTKESIAEHLWGDDADNADTFDFIYSHIKNLRKKITDAGGDDAIRSVYGMGYKFNAA
ncbi:MAG: response regulator transcription factor [Chitinophagales bacterium]